MIPRLLAASSKALTSLTRSKNNPFLYPQPLFTKLCTFLLSTHQNLTYEEMQPATQTMFICTFHSLRTAPTFGFLRFIVAPNPNPFVASFKP